MNRFTIAIALLLSITGFAACKKKEVVPPAVVVRVVSVSYPPTEENSYIMYTASIELKRTDESYYEKKYVTGTGEVRFENLRPGEYWINEQSTRESDKFVLRVDETRKFTFVIP